MESGASDLLPSGDYGGARMELEANRMDVAFLPSRDSQRASFGAVFLPADGLEILYQESFIFPYFILHPSTSLIIYYSLS